MTRDEAIEHIILLSLTVIDEFATIDEESKAYLQKTVQALSTLGVTENELESNYYFRANQA